MTFIRALAAAALVALAACASNEDLTQRPEPIGDFRLGHNIVVVTDDVTQGPFSREATPEQITTELRARLAERLGRYDGDGLYHIGVKVEAYVLAQPGIPLVFAPKSVMILALNVWDNATRKRLNEDPIRIHAFEGLGTGVPFVPSGFVKSGEEQLRNLSISAAREIERELKKHRDTWFAPKPGQVRVAFPPEGSGEAAAAAVPLPPSAN